MANGLNLNGRTDQQGVNGLKGQTAISPGQTISFCPFGAFLLFVTIDAQGGALGYLLGGLSGRA